MAAIRSGLVSLCATADYHTYLDVPVFLVPALLFSQTFVSAKQSKNKNICYSCEQMMY